MHEEQAPIERGIIRKQGIVLEFFFKEKRWLK
jgi:hypothetical protein